jgi:glycosyltransferase involved in cell wall biosynthesis
MTPLHVYWDLYGKNYPSGIVQYAKSLAFSLENLGIHPKIPLFDQYKPLAPLNPIWIPSRGPLDLVFGHKMVWPRVISRRLKQFPNGIFHGLSNMNVPLDRAFHAKFVSVVTVHDIIPLLAPSAVSASLFAQTRTLLPRVLARVAKIVCVSEWTKSTLVEHYPFAADKAVVIPNGFPEFRHSERNEGSLKLLSVSRYEKYKRFDLLADTLRVSPADWTMTVVTNKKGADFLREQASDLMSSRRLVIRSDLTPAELQEEYKEASVYIHPSLYEGFCLPASEALASGVPVVYTKGTALDEFMDSRISIGLESNKSATAWSEAAGNIWSNRKKPLFVQELQQVLEHAPAWEKSAKKLLSLYQNLIK